MSNEWKSLVCVHHRLNCNRILRRFQQIRIHTIFHSAPIFPNLFFSTCIYLSTMRKNFSIAEKCRAQIASSVDCIQLQYVYHAHRYTHKWRRCFEIWLQISQMKKPTIKFDGFVANNDVECALPASNRIAALDTIVMNLCLSFSMSLYVCRWRIHFRKLKTQFRECGSVGLEWKCSDWVNVF